MSQLDDVLKKLNKTYGQNTIAVLGDMPTPQIECISTGSLLIDKILGGGIAFGRISEIYGTEGAGKTTVCLQLAASCQKVGRKVAYLDVEQAVDLNYAKKLGVDTEALIFAQPSSAEQCLEIACQLAECKEVGLIIIDSIGALAPQAELDGEMGDVTIGLVARLMSKFMRKITASLNTSNSALVCINQLRDKVSTGWSSGPTETTTGGRALKYFASQRLELKKSVAIKEKDEVVGNEVKLKAVKNKICPPMQTCVVPLMFGKGFDSANEVLDLAIEYDLIEKAGAWFKIPHLEERLQGRPAVASWYESHSAEADDLRAKVVEKLKGVEFTPEIEVDPETGEIIE